MANSFDQLRYQVGLDPERSPRVDQFEQELNVAVEFPANPPSSVPNEESAASDEQVDDQEKGDAWIHWSIADRIYDLPRIDEHEQVVRYGLAVLRDGRFSFSGMLVLTNHRLIFGRRRPPKYKIAAKVQFSVSILDIESIHRTKWLRLFPRLDIALRNGDRFSLSVKEPDAWIEAIIRGHDQLLGAKTAEPQASSSSS